MGFIVSVYKPELLHSELAHNQKEGYGRGEGGRDGAATINNTTSPSLLKEKYTGLEWAGNSLWGSGGWG